MNIYENRSRVIIFIILFISSMFFIRLVYLQVFAQKYKQFARENALQRRTIYPPRGLIYDRNGKILVSNEAVYDLMIIPSKAKNVDKNHICSILEIGVNEYDSLFAIAQKYSYRKPSVFLRNLSLKTYGGLQESFYEFQGFFVQPRMIRKYPFSIAANAFGYLGEVNDNDIEKSEGYYTKGDVIGITGIEKYYEKYLRGVNGEKYVLVDVFNIEQGSYENGELDREAIPGTHLISSIDYDLQAYAEQLLVGKIGSIVAIQPSTGEVLCLASSPTYDPSMLYGRQRSKNYQILNTDKNKPLFNRATNAMYPPGSTFKTAMALIGLKEGVITPSTTFGCPGGYFAGNLRIGCHEHSSPVDLYLSIVVSCNSYYCHVFRNVIDLKRFPNIVQAYDNWRKDVMELGLGRKTGIDLPGEVSGILPTHKRYDNIYGKGRWKSSNILSLAIGQAEISLTPIQLATFTSTIANRGYFYTPHIVKAIVRDNMTIPLEFPFNKVKIDTSSFRNVIAAMADVPVKGTAIRYGPSFARYNICGKTGTAQNPHGEEHSIFISFAPKEHPQIVVVAVIENAGQGAHWAAPICFLLTERYLTRQENPETKWIEEIMLKNSYNNYSPVVIPKPAENENQIEQILAE